MRIPSINVRDFSRLQSSFLYALMLTHGIYVNMHDKSTSDDCRVDWKSSYIVHYLSVLISALASKMFFLKLTVHFLAESGVTMS